MNRLFYPKLAATNIKKNAKTYVPYILTCIFTVAMFYMIRSLALNEGIAQMRGAAVVESMMDMGSWIVAIFAVIFLFYTNSFLIKRRKKEFGLYNILGMEKKHLSKIVAYETLYVALISLVIGLILGIAFDKVMYLLILKILHADIPLGFYVSWGSVITVLALFGSIFVLMFLNSLRQIHLSNPIELLKAQNIGEKEPKTKWFIALLGLVCLASGYYISISIENPVAALAYFFLAVILVIIGTYLLFTAGSIAVLKLMRKNKTYYYKPNHFIGVSGMIYRMKQNAVGLANICILSTMVLVMVSTTLSMVVGMEDIVETRYPYDITVYSYDISEDSNEEIMSLVDDTAKQNDIELTNEIYYTYLNFSAVQDKDYFVTDVNANVEVIGNIYNLFFVPLSDYNRITGEDRKLDDGEVFIYSNRDEFEYDELKIFDKNYKIVGRLDDFLGNGVLAAHIASSHFIVVKDMQEVEAVFAAQQEAYKENASKMRFCLGVDMDAEKDTKISLFNQIEDSIKSKNIDGYAECRENERDSFFSLYGGLFFLGIFLGILFIVATILIIYYKQISEGYDDRERYVIMQNVGMSREEVKKSIHSQILTVFFLPLITAGIHVVFAFPLMDKILSLLNLVNTNLYILCAVGTFIVFAILYAIIYSMTAKNYYRIVRQ